MITFTRDYKVSVQDFKQPSLLVNYARQVWTDATIKYEICRRQGQVSELVLINSTRFDGLVAGLDSSVTKPVKLNRLPLPAATAAVRFEEIYHLALGAPEMPGTDPNVDDARTIRGSGFEKKIYDDGSKAKYVTEILETDGSVVDASFPISSTTSIQATYTGGPLLVAGSGGTPAELSIQSLDYESVIAAAAANNITVEYLAMIPAIKAELSLAGVKYMANEAGVDGNDITIEMVDDGVFGAETMEFTGTDIVFHIAAGQTNAAILASVLNNFNWDSDPVLAVATVIDNVAVQDVVAATNLAGGADDIGDAGNEVVTVDGDSISVRLESGVSTATQVKAAVDGEAAAAALVTVAIKSSQGSVAQTAPVAEVALSGGLDAEAAMMLGQVELSDNGSPLTDGTEVEFSYQTEEYTIYDLSLSGSQKVVIASLGLVSYLEANQA